MSVFVILGEVVRKCFVLLSLLSKGDDGTFLGGKGILACRIASLPNQSKYGSEVSEYDPDDFATIS